MSDEEMSDGEEWEDVPLQTPLPFKLQLMEQKLL